MNGSFFSQIYTNGAILSIFFYFSTPFLYACVFGMGLFFLLVRLGSGGNTKDFLSLSKKAPPQLSGLLACRYGRRRGAAELAPLKQSLPFFFRLPCVFAAR